MWIDDQVLKRCSEDLALAVWVPDRPLVVLGSSNQAEIEADTSACSRDQVPILKRYGGGGTVVLHHGCVVVSVGCWVSQVYQNKPYFVALNNAVIAALQMTWPELTGLGQHGLSDLTYQVAAGERRKVAGTSLFRSRNYLLYQASLLVSTELELIELYLRHPSKEPDYRAGRSHRHFLLGLSDIAKALTAPDCAAHLQRSLPEQLRRTLGAELIASKPEQWASLHRRAGS